MTHRRRRRRDHMSRRHGYDAGQEAAPRHIEEAREFSREIGGTDKDVKDYFFSLEAGTLDKVLSEYGRIFGSEAEDYARKTLPRWRSGATTMSGLVAKRLFNLLPPRMPIEKKFELAGNVWRHFGPSSSHSYVVGPNADVGEIAAVVAKKLDEAVTRYRIPDTVKRRFTWLAAGDVKVEEQLLNHFRQIEKSLALQKVNAEMPVLQKQVRAHPDITSRAKSEIQIHKHRVSVWVDERLDTNIREGRPSLGQTGGSLGNAWVWFVIAAIVLAFVVLSN